MVDLPKVPRRLVTTEAPRSALSAEAVGAPFAIAARGLTTLGEGVEAAGVRLAEEEGLRAVQTGPDGQPTFEPAPLFSGRAGEAYNRAARAKHFADFQTASERDYAKARLEFRGNPEGFAEWSESYNKTLVEKQNDERTKIAIAQHLNSAAIQGHRALAAEKQNLDIESSATALKRRQELTENNITSLYQQGAGPDTPEIKAYLADRAAILNERVANPLFRYSKQEREIDDQLFEVKTTALQLVGQVRKKAESDAVDEAGKPLGGAQKAKEFAESLLTDPRLNLLSIEQRHHYYRLAVAEIRALDVENQVLVNQLNAEAQQWKKAIEKGEADPEAVRDFLGRASSAKAIKGFTLVTNTVALNEQLRGWFDRLPPEERTAVQLQLQGKLGDLADRIVRAESGGDPFSRATTSTATGLGQFTEKTWLSLIRRYKPEAWATASEEEILAMRNDPALSREMVIRNADESRDALTKAGIKVGDREIYLAHFLGTPDAIKVLKAHSSQSLAELVQPQSIAANEKLFASLRTAGDLVAWAQKKVGVPEIPSDVQNNPALLNAIHARRKQALATAFPIIEKRINQTETITDEELEQFGALVFSVGTDEQKQKALELAVRLRVGSTYSTMTAQQRSDLLLEFSRVFASGAAKIDSDIGLYARQLNQDITTEYQRDPYNAAVRYGKRPQTPALDFSNPETLQAGLVARSNEQRWIRQSEGIGVFSLLRPAESETLAAHLTKGDPAAVAPVLRAILRSGDQDEAIATLSSKPIASALKGMILSGSAERMDTAFSALDLLWQQNAAQFEASFGEDVYKKLAIWQANLGYKKPEEIADMMRRAEDPQVRIARDKVLKERREEVDKFPDADLLSLFGTQLMGVPLFSPRSPVTPIQMQVLRGEFATIYANLRADGVSVSDARTRAAAWTSQSWAPSIVNDSRLMRRPPEQWAPMIDGSHDWLDVQVKEAVTKALGKPQMAVKAPNLVGHQPFQISQNWSYQLVADPQTEGEFARLKQWKAANPNRTPPSELWPSYRLLVFDTAGRAIDVAHASWQRTMEQGPFNIAGPLKRPREYRFRFDESSLLEQRSRSNALARDYPGFGINPAAQASATGFMR